jgi:hypothetical protein
MATMCTISIILLTKPLQAVTPSGKEAKNTTGKVTKAFDVARTSAIVRFVIETSMLRPFVNVCAAIKG